MGLSVFKSSKEFDEFLPPVSKQAKRVSPFASAMELDAFLDTSDTPIPPLSQPGLSPEPETLAVPTSKPFLDQPAFLGGPSMRQTLKTVEPALSAIDTSFELIRRKLSDWTGLVKKTREGTISGKDIADYFRPDVNLKKTIETFKKIPKTGTTLGGLTAEKEIPEEEKFTSFLDVFEKGIEDFGFDPNTTINIPTGAPRGGRPGSNMVPVKLKTIAQVLGVAAELAPLDATDLLPRAARLLKKADKLNPAEAKALRKTLNKIEMRNSVLEALDEVDAERVGGEVTPVTEVTPPVQKVARETLPEPLKTEIVPEAIPTPRNAIPEKPTTETVPTAKVEPEPIVSEKPVTGKPFEFPQAKESVGGLVVRDKIPNQESIEATLANYEILPGIREVKMSDFTGKPDVSKRSKELANEIRESGEINPLIVVEDKDGLYILEGANRWDALHELEVERFPAMIVRDLESLQIKRKGGKKLAKELVPQGRETEKAKEAETGVQPVKSEEEILERGRKTEAVYPETQMSAGFGPIKIPEITIGAKAEPKVKFEDVAKETEWNAAKGRSERSFFEGVKEKLSHAAAGFTRQFVHLPNEKRFANAIETLRQLKSAPGTSSREALEVVKQLVKDVDVPDIDLAMRKLKLEDYRSGLEADKAAPFGFTADEIGKEIAKIDGILKTSPKADRIVKETRALLDELGKKMVDADILKKSQLTKNYFHREILRYANEESTWQGTGKKLKRPRPGFAKARKGSELPDNTDYIQAFYSFLSDAKFDLRVADSLKRLRKEYDILPKLKAENKGKGFEELLSLEDADGHTLWQPEVGNNLFRTNSVSQKIADELMKAFPAGIEITTENLKSIMALGGKKETWLIPDELVKQLNDMRGEALIGGSGNKILKTLGIKQATTAWKVWTLLSPKRVIQYNFRNFIGDADGVFAAQPGVFKKVPEATKALKEYFFEAKPMSKELREFNEFGGIGSTFTEVEARDISKVRDFERLYSKTLGEVAKETVRHPIKSIVRRSGWDKISTMTEFREDILRFAAYLHYKEKAGTGKLTNYGASKKELVDGLKNPNEKAAKIARELLGDYAAISKYGESLRNSLIPFYSWMEINAKRWPRLVKNAFEESKTAGIRSSALLGGKIAAGFASRVVSAYATTYVWNNYIAPLVFGENIEDQLSEYDRKRLHISLGKNDDGTVRLIRTPGASGDFLEWFGFNELPVLFDMVSRNVISIGDALVQLAKAPVNKVAQGINPWLKLPAELASEKQFFPDVFNPGPVMDKWEHIARAWQLETVYRQMKDIPQKRSIGKDLTKSMMLITEYDPTETAYYDVLALKRDFMRSKGREAGFGLSEKSQTYRNYKKAIRYGQREIADALLKEMAEKGWISGLEQSLRALNPMHGLNKADQVEFRDKYLNGLQRQKLIKAIDFYNKNLEAAKIPQELKVKSKGVEQIEKEMSKYPVENQKQMIRSIETNLMKYTPAQREAIKIMLERKKRQLQIQ